MKKFNLLFLGALVLFAGFFSSCKKDETNDASISLAGDTGYTASDATVTAGDAFKVKWTATSTIDMSYISITKDDNAITGWDEKEIASASKSTYIGEATINVPLSGGPYTYAIVVFDKNKVELARKEIVITIAAAAAPLTSYTAKLLGGPSNSVGSLFVSATGTILKQTEVTATNGPTIDITYGVNSSTPTIISASVRGSQGYTAITGATETKYIASSLDFATVTSAQVAAIDFASAVTSIAVAQGNTYAFKNAAGKIGLFKVTAIVAGNSGSCTIDVKVQQ